MEIEEGARNVLVAHQFVTGAMRCESEEVSVGGLDNVDASVFDDFDYVALGISTALRQWEKSRCVIAVRLLNTPFQKLARKNPLLWWN